MALLETAAAIGALKNGIDIMRQAWNALSPGKEKDDLAAKIAQAEEQIKLAEGSVAIGAGAFAESGGVAIGSGARAGKNSVSIGYGAGGGWPPRKG
jgi:hypothetical protein